MSSRIVAYKDVFIKCPVYACWSGDVETIPVKCTVNRKVRKICPHCIEEGWRFYPGYLLPLKFDPKYKQ